MLQIILLKRMKKHNLGILTLFLSLVLVFSGCSDDHDDHDHEKEVITTVQLTFTQLNPNGTVTAGVAPIVATWKDADGTGVGAPTVNQVSLKQTTLYRMEVAVLNELANPAQDLTSEIRNEGTKHQFFFQKTGTYIDTVIYDDQDSNGKPIGLKNKLQTFSNVGVNTLKVILRHEPNKNGANVSSGNITNAGGETDIETTPAFSLNITL
jgi:hypothetical protein